MNVDREMFKKRLAEEMQKKRRENERRRTSEVTDYMAQRSVKFDREKHRFRYRTH